MRWIQEIQINFMGFKFGAQCALNLACSYYRRWGLCGLPIKNVMQYCITEYSRKQLVSPNSGQGHINNDKNTLDTLL